MRFGNQAEEGTISVETPWTSLFNNFKPGFVMTVKQLICDTSCCILVSKLKRFRTVPLHIHDRDYAVRQDATDWQAHLNLGNFFLSENDRDKAIPELQETLRLKPSCEPAKQALARAQGQAAPDSR